MLRVYVAGKYSDDNVLDVLNNIRKGIKISKDILLNGMAPFCPWLDYMYILMMTDGEVSALQKETMYNYSLEWLRASHVMFLLPERIDDSVGVQMEIADAERRGIPIFTDMQEMIHYAELSRRLHASDANPEVTPHTSPEQCSETETAG